MALETYTDKILQMVYKTSGCNDCPFCFRGMDEGAFCQHPKFNDEHTSFNEIKDYDKTNDVWVLITPEWCPIRHNPGITIKFKEVN